jgi:hypothetical protein
MSFEGSTFRGSPVLLDVNGDGTSDIGVVDRDANLYWLKMGAFGQYLDDFHATVPRLKVQRDWYKNLDQKWADSMARVSMFDHGLHENNGDMKKQRSKREVQLSGPKPILEPPLIQESYPGILNGSPRKLLALGFGVPNPVLGHSGGDFVAHGHVVQKSLTDDHPVETSVNAVEAEQPEPVRDDDSVGVDTTFRPGMFDDYSSYIQRQNEFVHNDDTSNRTDTAQDFEAVGESEGDGLYQYGVQDRFGEGPGRVSNGYDIHEFYYGSAQTDPEQDGNESRSQYVWVDPHVLASPALADVNGDGNMELIIPISYYFDSARYTGTCMLMVLVV